MQMLVSTKGLVMRKPATLALALATLGFLSIAATAEMPRYYFKVNLNALEAACLNSGGAPQVDGPGSYGCKQKHREVNCQQTGGGSGPGDPVTGTCTCTGNCPSPQQRSGPGGTRSLLAIVKGGTAFQPALSPANTKGGAAPGVRAPAGTLAPPSTSPAFMAPPATFKTVPPPPAAPVFKSPGAGAR
jgi:hypothetical protein